jgi:hypothetical protein
VNIKDFTMRWATRSVRPAAAAGLVLASIGAAACGSEYARQGDASSYLIIQNLFVGTETSNDARYNSDVAADNGSIFEDMGIVRFAAAMHDVTNANAPSTNNIITVDRYRVEFRRSDGRNTPGVDVPYAFDGAITVSLAPGDTVSVPFVLVRVQSKLEAPLAALRGHGGAAAISTIAEVTFYGHDQAGRSTVVRGLVSINFADWAG